MIERCSTHRHGRTLRTWRSSAQRARWLTASLRLVAGAGAVPPARQRERVHPRQLRLPLPHARQLAHVLVRLLVLRGHRRLRAVPSCVCANIVPRAAALAHICRHSAPDVTGLRQYSLLTAARELTVAGTARLERPRCTAGLEQMRSGKRPGRCGNLPYTELSCLPWCTRAHEGCAKPLRHLQRQHEDSRLAGRLQRAAQRPSALQAGARCHGRDIH
jgi:hypothetical protein